MPEGPEIKLAADKIAKDIIGRLAGCQLWLQSGDPDRNYISWG